MLSCRKDCGGFCAQTKQKPALIYLFVKCFYLNTKKTCEYILHIQANIQWKSHKITIELQAPSVIRSKRACSMPEFAFGHLHSLYTVCVRVVPCLSTLKYLFLLVLTCHGKQYEFSKCCSSYLLHLSFL